MVPAHGRVGDYTVTQFPSGAHALLSIVFKKYFGKGCISLGRYFWVEMIDSGSAMLTPGVIYIRISWGKTNFMIPAFYHLLHHGKVTEIKMADQGEMFVLVYQFILKYTAYRPDRINHICRCCRRTYEFSVISDL